VTVLAAGPGFEAPDWYAVGLLFAGIAIAVAIGALSHQQERAFSASLIYLVVGTFAAVVIQATGLRWLDPIDDAEVIERLTELALIVALFASGLKLDRALDVRAWAPVGRLLGLVMPVTIVAVATYGHFAMGLSVAAAVVLGAALAPTDPVLAGDIGVGPPGEEEERQPNFSITAEAGLNDGLAFPFVLLGLFAASRGGWDWLAEWALADVLYAVPVGLIIGALCGYGLAAGLVALRARGLLSPRFDGWIGIVAVLAIYGLAETASSYGFLAAFAGGLAFRRYEHDHELNVHVHHGIETVEKFTELAVILLLGSLLTIQGLEHPGSAGWLLAPLLLFVVRPGAVFVTFIGSPLSLRERLFLGWFGVRGVGSLYYVAVAVAIGALGVTNEVTLFWTVAVCVLLSILLHGITGAPLARRLPAQPRSSRMRRLPLAKRGMPPRRRH
jgi:NhaP-type Na+/H+ or K+/H+ antiporter